MNDPLGQIPVATFPVKDTSASVWRSIANNTWLVCGTAFCLVFGISLILNIHPVGDGDWFWYAQFLRRGDSLYGTLHMPMQPLYVLMTEATQVIVGSSWLASKILALFQLIAFCWILDAICLRMPVSDRSRCGLVVSAFSLSVVSTYARFDDFHITSHVLLLTAVYLLIHLENAKRDSARGFLVLSLGCVSGLSIANRINDGVMLTLSVTICICTLLQERRSRALAQFFAPVAVMPVILIWLTHSTLNQWLRSTIIDAARIKGGSGHLLRGPLMFPVATLHGLVADHGQLSVILSLTALYVSIAVYLGAVNASGRAKFVRPIIAASLFLASAFCLYKLQSRDKVLIALIATTIVALYASALSTAFAGIRFLLTGRKSFLTQKSVLLLVPVLAVTAGAITSGGAIDEALAPIASGLLILVLVSVTSLKRRAWAELPILLITSVFIICTVSAKIRRPYMWHSFRNGPLYSARTWYQHPKWGPMYIESRQLALFKSMCDHIGPQGQPTELLALPWPYPNYFCGVPPWHAYVQTWYDTSSRETAAQLTQELAQNPPEWIVYQRNEATLAAHERAFGGVLPHRALDDLLRQRIISNQWSIAYESEYDGADWLLVRTKKQPQ